MSDAFKPFAFDREFAADGTVLRDGSRIRKVLTEGEAQAMAEEAAHEARQSEEAAAARISADALRQFTGQLQALYARLDTESEALREDAVRLAMAAARAIAGEALRHYGADTIEACVKEALCDLRAEPRIAVRVAPHLADTLAERLYSFAESEGMDGAVIVRADDEVGAGDCVLEWRSGAIERTQTDIEARISEVIGKWMAEPGTDQTRADGTGTPGSSADERVA